MIEYENQFAQIHYEHPLSLVKLLWTTKTEKMTDGELRGTLLAFSSQTVKYRASRAMVDTRNFRLKVNQATQTWALETLLPFMVQVGLKKMAILLFEGSEGEELAERLWVEGDYVTFEVKYFQTETEAIDWLRK